MVMRDGGRGMGDWGQRMSRRRDEWNGSLHLTRQQLDDRNDRMVKELLGLVLVAVMAVLFSAWIGMF